MCFSATASFITTGVVGAIGVACLYRAADPRERLLAATPLVFALQQGIEGALWLTLPTAPDGPAATSLTYAFLLLAEVLWPIYSPLAVLMAEPDERRRRVMRLCLMIGVGAAVYLLWSILIRPHSAAVTGGHIVYVTEYPHSVLTGLAYLAATALPLLLSSRRTIVVLGAIVLVGSAVAYAFYWEAYVSVWCFFAAAASVIILSHFEIAHRHRLRVARA
jgi:hypothetical protein